MKMVSNLRKYLLLSLLTLFACCFFSPAVLKAEAATEYVSVSKKVPNNSTVKIGPYYFKCSNYSNYYISKQKNGNYTYTRLTYDSFTNGTYAYYIDSNRLYRYTLSTGTITPLKSFTAKGDYRYTVSAIYGNKIYISRGSFSKWRFDTYSYNLKTKKTKLEKKNCNIESRYKNYVVASKEYRSDVGPYTLTVYKITSSGLKKVKQLSKNVNGRDATYAGSKLYYIIYPEKTNGYYSMGKAYLYRCNANGSKKKKIGTFSSKQQYACITVQNITSKNCTVYIDGKNYLYTYATKKMKLQK